MSDLRDLEWLTEMIVAESYAQGDLFGLTTRQGRRIAKRIQAELDRCGTCLGTGWVCEEHPDRPWSGIVGDGEGCEPACVGPGIPCRCFLVEEGETDE